MIYSSAYIFGQQITAGGTPPLSDNVYFDDGRFNLNIIPDGFDFVNTIQRFPVGAAGQGETAIMQNGYFEQYVKTGTILASYGGGGKEFSLAQSAMEHIYDQGVYPSSYFWTSYFLPVKKDMWNTGLKKVCANIAISTVGKTDTDYMAFDMAGIYHDPDYDTDRGHIYMFPRWVNIWQQYTETLTEQTVKADFSEMFNFNDTEFIYILIRVPSSGTYIIRKIWFE